MDQRRLHELLTALHEELLAAGPVDTKNRDLLQHLSQDIRAIVEAEPGAATPERYQGLSGRLREAAATFEASHPRLTTAMEKVIDTLAFYNL
jgi:hypothetical protein